MNSIFSNFNLRRALAWCGILLILARKSASESQNVWTCADGLQVISKSYRCDEVVDCEDRSDEGIANGCEPRDCYTYEFTCDNNECVSQGLVCNGEADCGGGDDSDEKMCQRPPVIIFDEIHGVGDSFTCLDGKRIPKLYVCDGELDCDDNSDEFNCSKIFQECPENTVRCNSSGECIEPQWKCDGDRDCDDNEDELNCGVQKPKTKSLNSNSGTKPCGIDEFSCQETCLKVSKACDGVFDCQDGSDESYLCHFNACRLRNNASLWPDFLQFRTHLLVCDHACGNTPEGPRCYCFDGYSLADNGYTCRLKGNFSSSVLFAADNEIRSRSQSHHNIHYDVIVKTTNPNASIVSLDYDLKTDSLVWVDSNAGVIQIFQSDWESPKVFLKVKGIKSMKLDWMSRNIYLGYFPPGSTSGKIGVVSFSEDSRKQKADLASICDVIADLNIPVSITIYFQKRKIIFVEQDSTLQSSKIRMSNMDGSSLRNVVQSENSINCVDVDQTTDVLYWTESNLKMGSIKMMSLDSRTIRVLLSTKLNNAFVRFPFSLTVFEDVLYYTDQATKEIWAVDSVTGKSAFDHRLHQPLIKTPATKNLLAVTISHPVMQLNGNQGPSECFSKGCSHVCVLLPFSSTCLCPPFSKLSTDRKTCNVLPISTTTTIVPSLENITLAFTKEKNDITTTENFNDLKPGTTSSLTNTVHTFAYNQFSENTATMATTSLAKTHLTTKPKKYFAKLAACNKPIASLTNSFIINSFVASLYPNGQVLHLRCHDGWHVKGDVSRYDYLLTCDDLGVWQPSDEVRCIPYTCNKLNCGPHGTCVNDLNIKTSWCKCKNGDLTTSTCPNYLVKTLVTVNNSTKVSLPYTKYRLVGKLVAIVIAMIVIICICFYLFRKYYRRSPGTTVNLHYLAGKQKDGQVKRLATITEEDEKKIKGNNNCFANPNYSSPHVNKKGYKSFTTKLTSSRDSGFDRSSSSSSDDCSNSDPSVIRSSSGSVKNTVNTIKIVDNSNDEYLGSVEVLEAAPLQHTSFRQKFSNMFYMRKTESREHMITSP